MVLGFSNGGPVTIIYGLLVMSILYVATAFSLSELATRYPTAGGQYHWTSILAPRKLSRGLVSPFTAFRMETESCLELRMWLCKRYWKNHNMRQRHGHRSPVPAWYRCLSCRFLYGKGLAHSCIISSDEPGCVVVRFVHPTTRSFHP